MLRKFASILGAASVVAALVVAVPAAAVQYPQDQLVSGQPGTNTPHVTDGIVMAIAEVGDKIVLGGNFTTATSFDGTQSVTRNRILAFDKRTGRIDPNFAPNFNNTVRDLLPAADGESIYVGGQFSQVNGSGASKLVRLDIDTGQEIAAFNPGLIDGVVYGVEFSRDRLVVGGQFTTIGGTTRSKLAALNPTTGALLPDIDFAIEGTHNGGDTHIIKMDVTPDGDTLVAVGNFRTFDGQDRVQVALVDLSSTPAALHDWQTARFEPNCYSVFERYANDVDFSPDGSYFVVTTWGGYGSGPPTLCDTATRWETGARGSGLDPTWVSYTGGDSLYAVAVTDAAIYVGGHNRWMNNPFAGDRVGPGAVDREGLAAIDPANGVPLSWNPGRDRGRGVFDLLATDTGLYVGSDTDRIARYLYRARIAFFPLEGGSPVPQPTPPALPVDINLVSPTAPEPVSERYLYRVNAAGPQLPAIDQGPPWATDTGLVSGGNTSSYAAVGALSDAVDTATTPSGLYSSERWGPQQWDFGVPSGKEIQVNLHFANRFGGTAGVGQRVFDVSIDGDVVLDNYDIVADVGHNTGTTRSFSITSDGNVDIDLSAVVENPLINGIDIVDPSIDPPAPPEPSRVLFRANGGSGQVLSVDDGPDWGSGAGFVSGGNTATWSAIGSVDSTVDPATTPLALYSSERWGPHQWDIPIPAGTNAEVRLYFGNQCNCTEQVGQRVFDVSIDGNVVLDDYDIVADVGDQVGTVKTFPITSDGTVDIDFNRVVENPLINGIEIIDPSIPPSSDPLANSIARRGYDGVEVGATGAPPTGDLPWAQARGAFMADDMLYTAWANGSWTKRSYDGTAFGQPTTLELNGLGDAAVEAQSMTGLFYDGGHLYFTLAGSQNLYKRGFSVESDIIGALRPIVTGPVQGINWSSVRGMFVANGNLYWVDSGDGTLHRAEWTSSGPVPGTDTIVSGPAVDGNDWRARALFTTEGSGPNRAPTAAFSVNCDGGSCTFDGADSSDVDGSVEGWSWDFGDGQTDTGVEVSHQFASIGDFTVTLTVTDDDGATDQTSDIVTIVNAPPTALATVDCTGSVCEFDGSGSTDVDGTVVAWDWEFGDGQVDSGETVTHTYAADGAVEATLTVTDDAGDSSSTTVLATPGNASPVAAFSVTCDTTTCLFDGTGSEDVDGSIEQYAWSFGDGNSGSGETVSHEYSAGGTYSATLTVTDNRGATGSATQDVRAATTNVELVGSDTFYNGSATQHTVDVPTDLAVGDPMVAFFSTNSTSATATAPNGWTLVDDETTRGMRGRIWTKVATAEDIGQPLTIDTGTWVRSSLTIAAYRGAVVDQVDMVAETQVSADHTAPAVTVPQGSIVVWFYSDKTASTTSWTEPTGTRVLQMGAGTGAGHMSWLLVDSGGPLSGDVPAQTATADSGSSNAVMASIVMAPQAP